MAWRGTPRARTGSANILSASLKSIPNRKAKSTQRKGGKKDTKIDLLKFPAKSTWGESDTEFVKNS